MAKEQIILKAIKTRLAHIDQTAADLTVLGKAMPLISTKLKQTLFTLDFDRQVDVNLKT